MTLLFSYSSVLYDGDWGEILRPIILEILAPSQRYKGSFFFLRRAIRIGMIENVAGELNVEYFLEAGGETYTIEILLPTIAEVKEVLDQMREINRVYKQEEDYAAVDLSNIKIEPRKGRYYCTCVVQAIKSSKIRDNMAEEEGRDFSDDIREFAEDAVSQLKKKAVRLKWKATRFKNVLLTKYGGRGELGPDRMFRVKLTRHGRLLAERKIRNFNKTNIWREISVLIYQPAKKSISSRITRIAPADTRRLQKSMIASMSPAGAETDIELPHLMGDGFQVSLGTPGIYYARYVNDMPVKWLRHPGTHKQGSKGRLNNILRDPNAEAKWFDKSLFYGRSVFKNRWKVFQVRMSILLGGGQIGYNEFKKSFSVRFK